MTATTSALTVSISLGIETNNAPAGPATLPQDIQALPPITIETSATTGRVPFDTAHSNTTIVSSHLSGGTVTVLPKEHIFTNTDIVSSKDSSNLANEIFAAQFSTYISQTVGRTPVNQSYSADIVTGFSDVKLTINPDQKYIYTQAISGAILPKITEKFLITTAGGPLGTVQALPKSWEATQVFVQSGGDSPAFDFLGTGGQVSYTLANHTNQVGGATSGGNVTYDTAGTHSWTCPAGVTSVAVVCVGTGANGGYQWSSGGGGGGGLGYKNSISVTPGTAYTVVVGAKGSQVSNATNSSGRGGNTYFISEATVCGFGGGRGGTGSTGSNNGGYGGGYTGDGGGRGGNGAWEGSWTRGGGGAGGYSGNGGDGGRNYEGGTLSTGQGGGGGGGNYYSSTYGVGAGGGVGLGGEGANGAGGVTLNAGFGGRGGSGGQDGLDGENPVNSGGLTNGNYQIYGGEYGGGGGGSGTSRGGGYGGIGAVRIVWGSSVAFPSTNVGVAPTVGTSTTQVAGPLPVVTYSSFPANLGIDKILTNKSIITSGATAVIPSHLSTESISNVNVDTNIFSDPPIKFNSTEVSFLTNETSNTFISSSIQKQLNNIEIMTAAEASGAETCSPANLKIITSRNSGRASISDNMTSTSINTNPIGFLDAMPTIVPTVNTTLKFDPSRPKIINTSKDISFGAPTFCSAFLQTIFTANEEPLGYFIEDGYSYFATITDANDPRLTGTTTAASGGGGSGGGGGGETTTSGPVQSWGS